MKDALGALQQVLVVGGGSEIARAVVDALPLQVGADLWLMARSDPREPGAMMATPPDGAAAHWLPWSAGDDEAAVAAVATPTADLDLVLVAAGSLPDHKAAERDGLLAARTVRDGFGGLVAPTVAAFDRLVRQGHGALVVLSSVAAVPVRRSNLVYGATKSGLDGLALGLADAAAGTGVDVLVVRPGFVHGRMSAGVPAAPFAVTPQDVGAAVAAKVSGGGHGVVWVPAPIAAVSTVLRLLPRMVVRRLR